MNPMPGLYAELAKARACVDGKTFAEAAEAFKDVEGVKARIRHARASYRQERNHGPQERASAHS